jgi:hypothetical protein
MFDIESPDIETIVWKWAWYICNRCREIDAEDAAQDLWIKVLQIKDKWDPEKNASPTSFVYLALKRYSRDIINVHLNRVRLDKQYVDEIRGRVHHHDGDAILAAKRVRSVLKGNASRVFEVMVNPPKALFDLSSELHLYSLDFRKSTAKWALPTDDHVAQFLGISPMSVSRSMSHIKNLLKQEFDGDKKEKRNARI